MKKVIELYNIKFGTFNKKYNKNFSLTKEYRDFKNLLILSCKKVKLKSPYHMLIVVECYNDYDNILKPIGDALEFVGVIDNDQNILDVKVAKSPIRKNELGSLIVYVDEMYV